MSLLDGTEVSTEELKPYRAPTWARVPDIWNCHPRSPSTACNLAAQQRAEGGRAGAGGRGSGADLQPEGPLPPAGPGKPARQALALQKASAARGLVSHPVDRSVTAEAWCSWGGRGRGGGGAQPPGVAHGRASRLAPMGRGKRVSRAGRREVRSRPRRHPTRDPQEWGILLTGLSFGRC